MISKIARLKTSLKLPAFILLTVLILAVMGCGSKPPPLSPEGLAFKEEVGGIIRQMQQSLKNMVVKGNIVAIDAALKNLSRETAGICIDCPYKTAVLNKEGTLLTTFPNNEVVGRNFFSYKMVSEPLRKQKITQSLAYLASGAKIYFISAPLLDNDKVAGVVVLALTPKDIEKWHLEEKEFFNLNFNTTGNH